MVVESYRYSFTHIIIVEHCFPSLFYKYRPINYPAYSRDHICPEHQDKTGKNNKLWPRQDGKCMCLEGKYTSLQIIKIKGIKDNDGWY